MALKLEKVDAKDKDGAKIKGILRDAVSGRYYARFMVRGVHKLRPLEGAKSARDAHDIRERMVMLAKARAEEQDREARTVAKLGPAAVKLPEPPEPPKPSGRVGVPAAPVVLPEAAEPAQIEPEAPDLGAPGRALDGAPEGPETGKEKLPRLIRSVADLLKYNAAFATTKVAKQNGRYLLQILEKAGVKNPEGQPWSVLNEKTARAYRDAIEADAKALAKKDFVAAERLRRTAKSTLNQARACLSNELVLKYREHGVGDISGFKLIKFKVAKAAYESVPSAIWRNVIGAATKLRADDPGAWIGFLIGAGLGLRNREAAKARFDWLETDDDGKTVLVLRTSAIRTKTGRGRALEMPDWVLSEIKLFRGATVQERSGSFDKHGEPVMVRVPTQAEYLIPGTSETHRYNAMTRRLATVLRKAGLERTVYPKAYYELRKLFGSLTAHNKGSIFAAAGALGNLPTTAEGFYVDWKAGGKPVDVLKMLREKVAG